MRPTRRFRLPSLELDLSPLIDVVFNLLIFFICAARFRTAEGAIESYLPKTEGQQPASAEVEINEVRILLAWRDGAGRPTRGPAGRPVLEVAGETLGTPAELARGPRSGAWRRLHGRLVELARVHAGPRPLPVVIDVRPEVPHQHAVSALNEVVRAGLREVRFAEPERP